MLYYDGPKNEKTACTLSTGGNQTNHKTKTQYYATPDLPNAPAGNDHVSFGGIMIGRS